MIIKQLQVLAEICQEEFFEEDQRIFNQDGPAGALSFWVRRVLLPFRCGKRFLR
jgi:hypothetical protein